MLIGMRALQAALGERDRQSRKAHSPQSHIKIGCSVYDDVVSLLKRLLFDACRGVKEFGQVEKKSLHARHCVVDQRGR
ncbi:hypothetical protein CXB37_20620 [Pseudomonas syringae pv. syringae]|nr:hypothetical protein CXB37_20620 [Pseudomonas syringae pv. syringae]